MTDIWPKMAGKWLITAIMTSLNTAKIRDLYNTYLKLNKDDITKKQKTP